MINSVLSQHFFLSLILLAPLLLQTTTAVANKTPTKASQKAEKTTTPSSSRLQKLQAEQRLESQELSQYLQKGAQDTSNITWLGTPPAEKAFLSLYRADQTGHKRGLVLLLHDLGEHPDAPGLLQNLRKNLPMYGFSTMSVAMPNFSELFSKTETKTEGKSQQKTKTATIEPKFAELTELTQLAQNRLQHSLQYISKKGSPNVFFLAFGISANWIYTLLSNSAKTDTLKGIILINGYQPRQLKDFDLIQYSIDQNTPLLDLMDPNHEHYSQMQLRPIRAKQKSKKNYRSLESSLSVASLQTNKNAYILEKKIIGWMRKRLSAQQHY